MNLIIIALIILLSVSACTQKEEQNSINPPLDFRPNILWIVAEDMSPNIPSFGDSTIITPNLDRFAAEGVCYDNFYSAHPVCAPARASIITGMYANHIGASHMRTGPWWPGVTQETIDNYSEYLPDGAIAYEAVPPPGVKMFTEYLRAEGYYCSNNSKEDYQFRKTMTAWDESSNKAHWRNRPAGKPFFAVFNLGVTHESGIWNRMNDSLWVDNNLDVPVPPYLPDNEVGRQDVRRMYSNIKIMDWQAGKILKQLEEDGLLDSTIIFWYTDHGGPLPRQKRLLYDSGIKVPMIIRFPDGQFKGLRDGRMISFIDLAPTIMSLVNIKPPGYMDGKAFLGNYARTEEPQYVFGAADRFDELMDRVRSVRDDRYKYIKYVMPEKPMFLDVKYRRSQPVMQELLRLRETNQLTDEQALWFRESKPEEELFDVMNDPHELNNLADDPAYRDKLLELRQACEDWIKNINDTGLKPEVNLIEEMWPGFVQPQTALPVITNNGSEVSVICDTEGASIGYKIVNAGVNPDDKSWSVYTEPFNLPDKADVIAVAQRIGYKRSVEVRMNK